MKQLEVTLQQKLLIDALHEFNNNGQFAIVWDDEEKSYWLKFQYNNDEYFLINANNLEYPFQLITNSKIENIYFTYEDITINPHFTNEYLRKKYPLECDTTSQKVKIAHEEKRLIDIFHNLYPDMLIEFYDNIINFTTEDYNGIDKNLTIDYENTNLSFNKCERYTTYCYEDFTEK